MQDNETFSTANIQFKSPEIRQDQNYNDFETDYNSYEHTFENDTSDSEYEPQMTDNAEIGQPILNNMFM